MTRPDNEIERMIREKVHDPDYHGINTVLLDMGEIGIVVQEEAEVVKREPSVAHQNGIKLFIIIILVLIFFLL